MGLSAREVDETSLWELRAQAAAWRRANGGEEKAVPPSEEEHQRLIAKFADRRPRATPRARPAAPKKG